MLQIIFVVYLGAPVVLGAGYLLFGFFGAASSLFGQGSASSGVAGVYRGIPVFVSDALLGNLGALAAVILVPLGLLWLVFLLFTKVLPIIREDF
jgi:hypothetical protein